MTLNKLLRYLLYGFLLWITLLIYSFFVYYLKQYSVPLFDSLMFIAIATFTIIFVFILYRRKRVDFFKEGLIAGSIWMVENFLFDMFLFHWGPWEMSFTTYFTEIGLNYITIPIIVAGMGYLLDRVAKKIHHESHATL
jgi:hypothetical protein